MAGAALLSGWFVGIIFSGSVFTQSGLRVGIVALQTELISSRVFDFSLAMNALIQLFHDLVMAVHALIRFKKGLFMFAHVGGFRVKLLFRHIPVAVQAGGLAVG